MKRIYATMAAAILVAGSLMASGQNEEVTYSTMEREFIPYESSEMIEVTPSADILDIFSDNDDGSYSVAEAYLNGEADRDSIPHSAAVFISGMISDDPDDLLDTVRSELKTALADNESNGSFMDLGTYRFKAVKVKTDGEPTHIIYSRELIDFTPAGKVTIVPSDDILAVFSDNDESGLYDETLPFLTSESERNEMSKSSSRFVSQIIGDNSDDISDLIRSELKSALEKGVVEESEMILGNYRFVSTLEESGIYNFTSEEIYYTPENVEKINVNADILAIFEDNDENGMYETALPYLTGTTDNAVIPVAVNDYIAKIICEDCDDLMDEIRNTLAQALDENESDSVYLELGSYTFTGSTAYSS
jgi:hypothetical protein